MYVKEGNIRTWQWFVKWWDKFSHTKDVIHNVTWEEFPVASQSTVSTITHVKAQALAYPLVQATMPQPIAPTPATTSTTKPAKSSMKTKKKKSAFDDLSKSTLIALLRQQWKDEERATNVNSKEEDDQESGASSKASVAYTNPYYPYN